MSIPPQRRVQGLRDRAVLLVVVGFLVLFPPFLLVADHPLRVAGAPLFLVYVFGVWGLLIAANGWLARSLDAADQAAEAERDSGPAPAAGDGF